MDKYVLRACTILLNMYMQLSMVVCGGAACSNINSWLDQSSIPASTSSTNYLSVNGLLADGDRERHQFLDHAPPADKARCCIEAGDREFILLFIKKKNQEEERMNE